LGKVFEFLFVYLRELYLWSLLWHQHIVCYMACCTEVRYTELVINSAQAHPCVSEQYNLVSAKNR